MRGVFLALFVLDDLVTAQPTCTSGPTLFFSQCAASCGAYPAHLAAAFTHHPAVHVCARVCRFQEASRGNRKYYQIYNPTSAPIALSGYTYASCTNGCASGQFEYAFSFATGATIAAGGTYTVCNSGMPDTTACDESHGYPQVSYNGDDYQALIAGAYTSSTVSTAPSSAIVDQIGILASADPGSNWPICGSSSGMDTRNGQMRRAASTTCGDASGVAFDGTALAGTACPWTEVPDTDGVAAWPNLVTASPPAAPPPPVINTIDELQTHNNNLAGVCHASMHAGSARTTRGFVSAKGYNGFYMQSTPTGLHPNGQYAAGLWVYLPTGTASRDDVLAGVQVGYEIEVSTSELIEHYGLTEFNGVTVMTVISQGNALTPIDLTTGVIGMACNLSGERFEGMLVRLTDVMLVSEVMAHDEILIDDGSGRTQLDDGLFTSSALSIVTALGQPLTNKSIASIVGVVRYAFGSFEVHARDESDIVYYAPPPAVSSPAPSSPAPASPSPASPSDATLTNISTVSLTEETTTGDTGAIIGGVVGGVGGVLLIGALLVIYSMHRSAKAKPPSAVLAAGVPVEMMDPGAAGIAKSFPVTADDKI